ncbi:MAG TPA: ribonuclease P protein component [Candidatus Paceibacterota bacterium]|nr:ribonuclease P protein component [Candidatus Paceibacterota bacterium]
MLPKSNRVDRKTVEKVFSNGFFIGSTDLSLKFTKENNGSEPHVSFVVPKTTSKKATLRNLLRRRGYSALDEHYTKLPKGFVGIFIFGKNSPKKYGFKKGDKEALSAEIYSIIKRIRS